jgi:hypothetical protein
MTSTRAMVCFLILLAGCAPVRDDDDASCTTELRVCAHWGSVTDPVTDGFVRVRAADADSIETPVGTDGCAEMPLSEGLWEWQASNGAGDCVSSYEEIALEPCATVTQEVDLTQWCMDGR